MTIDQRLLPVNVWYDAAVKKNVILLSLAQISIYTCIENKKNKKTWNYNDNDKSC